MIDIFFILYSKHVPKYHQGHPKLLALIFSSVLLDEIWVLENCCITNFRKKNENPTALGLKLVWRKTTFLIIVIIFYRVIRMRLWSWFHSDQYWWMCWYWWVFNWGSQLPPDGALRKHGRRFRVHLLWRILRRWSHVFSKYL